MSAIKAGDVVMVVRGPACCGDDRFVGLVFEALTDLFLTSGSCNFCGRHFACLAVMHIPGSGFSLHELRRLPDILKDDIPTGEEITA